MTLKFSFSDLSEKRFTCSGRTTNCPALRCGVPATVCRFVGLSRWARGRADENRHRIAPFQILNAFEWRERPLAPYFWTIGLSDTTCFGAGTQYEPDMMDFPL